MMYDWLTSDINQAFLKIEIYICVQLLTLCPAKEAFLTLTYIKYTFLLKFLWRLGRQSHQLLLVKPHLDCDYHILSNLVCCIFSWKMIGLHQWNLYFIGLDCIQKKWNGIAIIIGRKKVYKLISILIYWLFYVTIKVFMPIPNSKLLLKLMIRKSLCSTKKKKNKAW